MIHKMIPLAKPYIGNEEIRNVIETMKSGQLSLGPKISKFEEKFSELIGTKYAVAVNSGTSGLHLCMKAINLKDGDEVITSPFSFIASSNCILFEGGKPIFVDVDEETFNMDPSKIEEVITLKTKAILVVHIFGQACDMDSIIKIANKHNLIIIEDSCESILSKYKDKKVGTFGKASVFAFYPNKQMTTAEGGMIVTNDEKIYKLCKSLRNQGRSDDVNWLHHDKLGFNYRMSDIHAAIGLSQLEKLDYMIKKRVEIANMYNKSLSKIKNIKLPYVPKYNKHTWFVYTIRISDKFSRDCVIELLRKKGISSKAYFDTPIHLQPFYKAFGYKKGDFPIAEKIADSIIAIPFFVELKDDEIIYICDTLREILK